MTFASGTSHVALTHGRRHPCNGRFQCIAFQTVDVAELVAVHITRTVAARHLRERLRNTAKVWLPACLGVGVGRRLNQANAMQRQHAQGNQQMQAIQAMKAKMAQGGGGAPGGGQPQPQPGAAA